MHDFRYVYCLFCETGREEVVQVLCEKQLGAQAIILKAERYHYSCGQRKKTTVKVLPSYIFLYVNEDIDPFRIAQIDHVYRILSLAGEYHLHDRDLRFAQWMDKLNGVITISQAYRQGDRIAVVGGPLKEYEGDIVWVDKRKGKAKIHLVTESIDTFIWLFFEYVEPTQPELNGLEASACGG